MWGLGPAAIAECAVGWGRVLGGFAFALSMVAATSLADKKNGKSSSCSRLSRVFCEALFFAR